MLRSGPASLTRCGLQVANLRGLLGTRKRQMRHAQSTSISACGAGRGNAPIVPSSVVQSQRLYNWLGLTRVQRQGRPERKATRAPSPPAAPPLAHVDWLPTRRPDGAAGQPAARQAAPRLAGLAAGRQDSPGGPLSYPAAGGQHCCGACRDTRATSWGVCRRCRRRLLPPITPCRRFAGTLFHPTCSHSSRWLD